MPKRGGALEWTLIVAAAQILFLDVARSRGRRPRGQGDARRSGQRAVRGARQRGAAHDRPRPRRDPGELRSARRRYARLARPALARDLRRERGARHRRGAPLGADARHQRQERRLPAGRRASAGSCCRPARCASTPIRPSPSSKAMRAANGGCRTPPRRCRRGCFGPARACGSSISAPRRAERRPSSPRRAPR